MHAWMYGAFFLVSAAISPSQALKAKEKLLGSTVAHGIPQGKGT